jgi:ribose transport system substrate-binding protein
VPTNPAPRSIRSVAVLAVIALIATACAGSSGASQPPASQAAATAGASQPAGPAASSAPGDFAIIQAVVAPYYASWPQAAKDAAADFGVKVEVGSPQKFDQVEQDAILNSFIAKGVNGIAVQPVDAVAGTETVKRIVASGIPVVGVGACAELDGSGAVMCINNALGDSAYEAAKLVCQAIGGSGNIVHFDGQLADKNTAARIAGVDKALAEMPGCKLLQRITDADAPEAGQNAVNALLAAQGDKIDGIVSGGYQTSVVIANTFTQRKEQRIKAVLVDDDPAVLAAVKAGYVLASRVSNPYMLAYLAADALKLTNDGCKWTGDFIYPNNYQTITADKLDTIGQGQVDQAKELANTWKSSWSCAAS